MQYYFIIDQNPDSPTYDKPLNVARVDKTTVPITEDSYSDHGWIHNPNLLWSISGIGGDGSQWKEITEEEANQFIASLTAGSAGQKPKLIISHPRDKSLQAFKDWIHGIVKQVNPDSKSTMTDEDWEKGWKEFWRNSDKT